MKNKRIWLISAAIFIFTLFLYIPRISPSVFSADSGDLLGAIISKGVAHPPGYPLFILLGRFFNFLPVYGTAAFKVGLLSALSTSLTVTFLFIISYFLTKKYVTSIIASVSYALIYTIWSYAEVVEVFSLANLLTVFLLLTIFLFWNDLERNKFTNKYYYILFFLWGVAFTNHHSILLLFIPTIFLFFPYRKQFIVKKRIISGLILFILGFSIYINVYLNARGIPFVNWDNPINISNFIHLFTRADYGSFILKGDLFDENIFIRIFQMRPYLFMLYLDWSFLGLFLILLGVVVKKNNFNRFYFFLIFSIIFYGPLFMFYSSPDLSGLFSLGVYERFVLLSNPFFVPFLALGLSVFTNFIAGKFKFSSKKFTYFLFLLQVVFLLLPLSLYKRNNQRTNFKRFTLGDDWGKLIYTSVKGEPKAILYIMGDDDIFTTWYYLLNNYKIPPAQIAVIAPDLLGMKGLDLVYKKYYPWVYFSELSLRKSSNELFGLMILRFIDKVPLYVSDDIKLPKGYKKYPRGPLFRIVREKTKIDINKEIAYYTEILNQLTPKDYISTPLTENFFVNEFINNYGSTHISYAYFFAENKKYQEAHAAIKEAFKYNPELVETYLLDGQIYNKEKKCDKAEKSLLKYRNIRPESQIVYDELINNAGSCFKDKEKENYYKDQLDLLINKNKKSLNSF